MGSGTVSVQTQRATQVQPQGERRGGRRSWHVEWDWVVHVLLGLEAAQPVSTPHSCKPHLACFLPRSPLSLPLAPLASCFHELTFRLIPVSLLPSLLSMPPSPSPSFPFKPRLAHPSASPLSPLHPSSPPPPGDSVRDDESVHSGGTDASGGAGARTADGSRGSKSLSSKRSSGQSSSCRAASTSSSPPAIAERSAPAATSKLRKAGGAMRGLGALGRSGSARAAPSTASGRAVPPGAGEGGGGARAPAGLGAGGLGADGGGNPFGGSVDKPAGYTPMDAGARAQMSAGRDAAIERMWADQENKVSKAGRRLPLDKERGTGGRVR